MISYRARDSIYTHVLVRTYGEFVAALYNHRTGQYEWKPGEPIRDQKLEVVENLPKLIVELVNRIEALERVTGETE